MEWYKHCTKQIVLSPSTPIHKTTTLYDCNKVVTMLYDCNKVVTTLYDCNKVVTTLYDCNKVDTTLLQGCTRL